MTHIEWHRAMHEQQRQIKEFAQILVIEIATVVTAFLLGLYCGVEL